MAHLEDWEQLYSDYLASERVLQAVLSGTQDAPDAQEAFAQHRVRAHVPVTVQQSQSRHSQHAYPGGQELLSGQSSPGSPQQQLRHLPGGAAMHNVQTSGVQQRSQAMSRSPGPTRAMSPPAAAPRVSEPGSTSSMHAWRQPHHSYAMLHERRSAISPSRYGALGRDSVEQVAQDFFELLHRGLSGGRAVLNLPEPRLSRGSSPPRSLSPSGSHVSGAMPAPAPRFSSPGRGAAQPQHSGLNPGVWRPGGSGISTSASTRSASPSAAIAHQALEQTSPGPAALRAMRQTSPVHASSDAAGMHLSARLRPRPSAPVVAAAPGHRLALAAQQQREAHQRTSPHVGTRGVRSQAHSGPAPSSHTPAARRGSARALSPGPSTSERRPTQSRSNASPGPRASGRAATRSKSPPARQASPQRRVSAGTTNATAEGTSPMPLLLDSDLLLATHVADDLFFSPQAYREYGSRSPARAPPPRTAPRLSSNSMEQQLQSRATHTGAQGRVRGHTRQHEGQPEAQLGHFSSVGVLLRAPEAGSTVQRFPGGAQGQRDGRAPHRSPAAPVSKDGRSRSPTHDDSWLPSWRRLSYSSQHQQQQYRVWRAPLGQQGAAPAADLDRRASPPPLPALGAPGRSAAVSLRPVLDMLSDAGSHGAAAGAADDAPAGWANASSTFITEQGVPRDSGGPGGQARSRRSSAGPPSWEWADEQLMLMLRDAQQRALLAAPSPVKPATAAGQMRASAAGAGPEVTSVAPTGGDRPSLRDAQTAPRTASVSAATSVTADTVVAGAVPTFAAAPAGASDSGQSREFQFDLSPSPSSARLSTALTAAASSAAGDGTSSSGTSIDLSNLVQQLRGLDAEGLEALLTYANGYVDGRCMTDRSLGSVRSGRSVGRPSGQPVGKWML